MSKKHRTKETVKPTARETKPHVLEPHWEKIVLLLLLLIPLVYFAQFLSPNSMIGNANSDYLNERYPLEKWTSQQKQFPLWYPDILGGVPVFGSPIGIPLAPLTWLIYAIPPQVVLAIKFIVFFFIAGLGMYLYLKEIGLSKYAAALGAFTYQFIGNLAATPYAGHAGRAASVAILPLLMFLVNRALKTKKLSYFIGFSLAAALAFYEGQFQINYYGLLFILAYFIYYLIARRKEFTAPERFKIIAYSLVAVVFIGLLMAVVWLPVLGGLKQAARGTERGFAWSSSWALPPAELIDLFIPSFSGILGRYWGSNPLKFHTEYFGLLIIIFAFVALSRFWKKSYVRFYAIAIIIVILTALGSATPFFRILYSIIPGFTFFRAPALSFYIASFGFIVLAAIGFENTIVKKELDLKKFLTTSGVFLAVLIIIIIIAAASGRSLAGPKVGIYEENSGQFTRGIFLGLLLTGVILGLIYLGLKNKIPILAGAAIAIILSLISQISVMANFLTKSPGPEKVYAADEIIQFLKQNTITGRIFPLTYETHAAQDNYLWYHGLLSAGGTSPSPTKRYQDYIGAGTSVMFTPVSLVQYPILADLLNIRYVIGLSLPEDLSPRGLSRYDVNTQRAIMNWKGLLEPYRSVYRGRELSVYENDRAFPKAYIVADYRIAAADEVLDILKSPPFDPRAAVILEDDPDLPHPPAKLPMTEAQIVSYEANRVVCQVDNPASGFLVLADNWHPDWRAFVDGKPGKLYRADYIFRAVYVPVGKHEIVFAYISKGFNTGKVVTLLSLIAALALIMLPAVMKKKTKNEPAS
jgi:hypothetical protein